MKQREIKFRAFDIDKNEMIYDAIEYQLRLLRIKCDHWESRNIGFSDLDYQCFHIMQFTGLHDKNGVEIYEFDKVNTPAGIGVIKWDKCFRIFWNESDSTTLHDTETHHMEIIGNIYEG